MLSEELDQGSEAAVPQLTRLRRAPRCELVRIMTLVAPMSAAAWRTLATWLEEVEAGIVAALYMEDDDVARVGERKVVRSCWQRVGMVECEKFSDEAFERYWARVSGK